MKGAAGPGGARGHRALGEGPGAAQAPSGRDAPCQRAGDSTSLPLSAPGMARAQLPWDRHRFTHAPTALSSAHPYWSGNTGMDNLVMSSSEEKSCLHFLK